MSSILRPAAYMGAALLATFSWDPFGLSHARAGEAEVQLVRGVTKQDRISGLELESLRLTPIFQAGRGPRDAFVEVHGHFARPHWSLLHRKRAIPLGESFVFAVEMPLTSASTPFELFAVGPKGELETERGSLTFIEIDGWLTRVRPSSSMSGESRWRFSAGLGATTYAFQQTGVSDFSQDAITAKFAVTFALVPSSWDLSANVYFTALPFKRSREDVTVIPLGANVRLGYRIPWRSDHWSLIVSGGAYFSSMQVTRDSFGYQNLMGPQIYPALKRRLGVDQFLVAYAKYSPVTDGIGLLALSNREVAFGLAWGFGVGNGRSLSLSMDYADLAYFKGTQIDASSTTLGVSVGW